MKDYALAGSPSTNGCGQEVFVSVFQNAYSKAPQTRTLHELVREIREGKYSKQIEAIRKEYARVLDQTGDPQKAKGAIAGAKKRLPGFCISGTAEDRKMPLEHSGFLQIDLDGLGESLPSVREKLKKDPHIAFVFVSPSGNGLKLGLRIDEGRHSESFEAAVAYFKNRYGLQIDTACKGRLRICFVSHDPELWTNWDATVLPVEDTTPPHIRLNPESASESCVLHPATTSYITPADTLRLIKDKRQTMANLESKRKELSQLFVQLVEPRVEPIAAGRNDSIVQLVPFLYRAVSPQLVLEFIGSYYDCHRALFNDPRDTHMKEAAFMLDSVKTTYTKSLTENERQIYLELNDDQQSAYRICRDLAHLHEPKRELLTFYLSCHQLGLRLGLQDAQAQRILRELQSFGITELMQKGTKRAPGVKGRAGIYLWRHPSEEGGNQQ